MVLTGYKWNGIAIRAPGGGLAGDTFCCCNLNPPTESVCCCPDDFIPSVLLATISDKTGDCTCLPNTVTLTYIGDDPGSGIEGEWVGSYEECDGGGCAFTLRCENDGETCYWTLGPSSCAVAAVFNSGESSCNPLTLVFDVDNSIGGSTNCTGTYKVTITFPP